MRNNNNNAVCGSDSGYGNGFGYDNGCGNYDGSGYGYGCGCGSGSDDGCGYGCGYGDTLCSDFNSVDTSISYDDIPPLDESFWSNAVFSPGGSSCAGIAASAAKQVGGA